MASTWPWPCPPGHTEWPAPPLPRTSANTASRFGVFFSRLNTRQEEGGVPSCQLPNHCPAPRGGAASSVEGMTASWSGLAPVTTPGLSALGSGESRAIFTSKAGASALIGAPVSLPMKQMEETQSASLCEMQDGAGHRAVGEGGRGGEGHPPAPWGGREAASLLSCCPGPAWPWPWLLVRFLCSSAQQRGESHTGVLFSDATWGRTK